MWQRVFAWLGRHFSLTMYLLIWLFGSMFALFGFLVGNSGLFDSAAFGELAWGVLALVSVFALLSFAHQLLVYISLHELEHDPTGWEQGAPRFIGSGPEVLLRVLCFFVLLLIGQKISLEYIHTNWNSFPHFEYFLPVLCVALFLLLLTWDVMALRSRGTVARWQGCWEGNRADLALAAIMLADLLALSFWMGFVLMTILHMTHRATFIIGAALVLLIYAGLIACRFYLLFSRRRIIPTDSEGAAHG